MDKINTLIISLHVTACPKDIFMFYLFQTGKFIVKYLDDITLSIVLNR